MCNTTGLALPPVSWGHPLSLLLETATSAPHSSQGLTGFCYVVAHTMKKKTKTKTRLWAKHFGENLCHCAGSQQQRWPENPLLISPTAEGACLPQRPAQPRWHPLLRQERAGKCPQLSAAAGSVMNRQRRTPSDALKHVFLMHAASMFSYQTNHSPAMAGQSDGHGGRRASWFLLWDQHTHCKALSYLLCPSGN